MKEREKELLGSEHIENKVRIEGRKGRTQGREKTSLLNMETQKKGTKEHERRQLGV